MSIFSKNSTPDSSEDKIADEQSENYADAASVEESVPVAMSSYEIARNEAPSRSGISKPSIISEGFEFVGTITSEGTLNIAGVVKGKITAKSVLVDVEGLVEGELNADLLMVKGKVTGDVKCQDLNVGPRALVDGTIAYQNIHIQRGGKVAGKFTKN